MFDRKYMTLIVISMIVISLIVVVATSNSLIYAQNQTKYKAKLIGKSVVPPVNTSAAGLADVNIGNDWLWWKLNVTGITDPTMAHIHMGKKGVNGPIVVDLLKSSPRFENTTERMIITGNISAFSLQGPMKGKTFADIQSAIKAKTVGLHVDLHTKNHPDGELRGTVTIKKASATTPIANKTDAAPRS
jgi:CHRD domain